MSLKSRWKPVRLPEKLLQIRKQLNLSQNEMLRHLGIEDEFHRQTISQYERAEAEPPLPILLLYAQAAGVSTDVLIDDSRELPKKLPALKDKTG
ncbi:MAG: helix-turn-helix domain-containing protein [Acidobacteria bacterium]|nr:helix-turn-helix domain-containing protein [Acidobacteriota bacterium]